MVQTGSTGPGTLAGTVALENAEILAAIVIAQTVAPGVPVGYGCSCHTADLRSMMISFGAPEQSLFAVANTQICRRYGFPSLFNTGLTDSKRVGFPSDDCRATIARNSPGPPSRGT
jgi:trimethylamine--corrinoid protein Co-methyltransferase